MLIPRDQLVGRLRTPDAKILVVTGAGISLASGIATFRGSDPGAVWANDVLEKATLAYFRANPVESWRWYLARFDGLASCPPNPAHHALTALQGHFASTDRPFTVVTQNIDTLHEAAGTTNLFKVHGSSDQLRCTGRGCSNGAPRGTLPRASVDLTRFLLDPTMETLPRCPLCASALRPHILWFDETYTGHESYQYDAVLGRAYEATCIVFIGTSFSVGITDSLVKAGLLVNAALFSLDPVASAPFRSVTTLRVRAEIFLPELVEEVVR